jgi:hypothetical protein
MIYIQLQTTAKMYANTVCTKRNVQKCTKKMGRIYALTVKINGDGGGYRCANLVVFQFLKSNKDIFNAFIVNENSVTKYASNANTRGAK